MKTTITEEFEDGKLVRRTTVTEGGPVRRDLVPNVLPDPSLYPSSRCTCTAWSGITPPPPCPVHGQALPPTVICAAD